MTIDIHDKCQRRLVQALTEALARIRVREGNLLDLETIGELNGVDAILPGSCQQQQTLADMIGDNPLATFLLGELWASIKVAQRYDGEAASVELRSVPGFGDLAAAAQGLIARFISLPWQYRLCVRLALPPDSFAHPITAPVSITDDLVLQVPDDALMESLSFGDATEALLGSLGSPWELATSWQTDRYYVLQNVSGYVPEVIQTSSLSAAEFRLKAFVGLGLAFGLLSQQVVYFSPLSGEEILVFKIDRNSSVRQSSHRLGAEASKFLKTLRVTDLGREHQHCRPVLAFLGHVLADSPSHFKLKLAANWFFDSYAAENELLGYVQATVCAEILLGYDKTGADFDHIGLTELLANRCAYLIAATQAERTEILADFKRIYGTRSDIVHRGKQKLMIQERNDLGLLRKLCAKVILREAKLMHKEGETNT